MSLAVFLGLVAGQYIWRPYFVAIRQIADEERAKQKVDKQIEQKMPPSTNDKFNQYRKRNPKIKLLNNILNRYSPLIGFTGLTGIALFYMSKSSLQIIVLMENWGCYSDGNFPVKFLLTMTGAAREVVVLNLYVHTYEV